MGCNDQLRMYEYFFGNRNKGNNHWKDGNPIILELATENSSHV